MSAARRLQRLEKHYASRAARTFSRDELLFLLRFSRRALRDGMESIAPQHHARAIPLLTLMDGEWS